MNGKSQRSGREPRGGWPPLRLIGDRPSYPPLISAKFLRYVLFVLFTVPMVVVTALAPGWVVFPVLLVWLGVLGLLAADGGR